MTLVQLKQEPRPSDLALILCERYAVAEGLDARCILVKWAAAADVLHLFDRETGLCLESPFGAMRGFQIHPDELARFASAPTGQDR